MNLSCFIWSLILLVIITLVMSTLGIEEASLRPRSRCFNDIQPNCNTPFGDAYPDLSMSYSNLTKADTWFLLYTRQNWDQPELLHKCGGRLPPNSKFNPTKRLVVIITPYDLGCCDVAVFREMKEQFLTKEDCNVLIIDFTWGSYTDYESAILNGKITGKQSVVVLKNIQEQTDFPMKMVYIVGHSLGGQVAGWIGGEIGIGRITGLDVAGPGFPETAPPSERLDPTDADIVDVWHTNAGPCLPYFGIDYQAGHIDYYINGGSIQPACYSYAFESLFRGDYEYGLESVFIPTICSHLHSTQYFKESINPQGCQYVAVKCEERSPSKDECNDCGENDKNCTIMGVDFEKYWNATPPPRGIYQVRTKLTCDYCDNSYLVKQPSFASG